MIRNGDDLPKRKSLAEGHIGTYDEHLAVYTDGSENTAADIASCSFYVPPCGLQRRMNDGSSVLTTEMNL